MMLQHIRRALQPIKEDRYSLTEFNKHGTMYHIFNAFASVAVIYLASTTSLNRWRALLKYDEVVTSPNSPLAFQFQPALQNRLRRSVRISSITLRSFLVVSAVFCGYAAFTQDYEHVFDQYMVLLLSIIFSQGFSVIIRLRALEGLFRVTTKRGWVPFFLTMRIGWSEVMLIRATSVGLGIYTTIQPSAWLITAAMYGLTFRFVSTPFIPHRFVPVSMWFLGYFLTLSILTVFMVFRLDKYGSSAFENPRPMGKRAIVWYSACLQYLGCFPGFLSSIVLRAEWATAQAAAETRTRSTFDIHYAEKEALLEKVDDRTEVEEKAIAPTAPELASAALPASLHSSTPATPTQPKAPAIRVPPVDPFRLSKDAKKVGRLEPFSSPVFNILLLATFLCYIPSILLSTPLINSYTADSVDWEILQLLPGQFWAVFVNPVVLLYAMLLRMNKGGREIWIYGEKWSKDLPKKEEPSLTTEAQVDVESQTPLLDGSAEIDITK